MPNDTLPAVASADHLPAINSGVLGAMPISLALFLDDKLYERVSAIAVRMSKADGITPKHLLGKPEACFAIVTRAITWKLDPFAVAMATYQTPGGSIGFEGKLVHAIIENSQRLEPGSGGVSFEYYGDWAKVQGRFTIRESSKTDGDGKPRKYAAATWTDDDAIKGQCGVVVKATLRGESKAREFRFDLVQAQPRNSTLWATDPKTQLGYTAVRRFASAVVPALLMGVPFDVEDNATPPEREINPDPSAVEMPKAKDEVIDATIVEQRTAAQAPAPAPAGTSSPAPVIPPPPAEADKAPAAAVPESGGPIANAGQLRIVKVRMDHGALSEADMRKKFGFGLENMPAASVNAVMAWIENPAG